MVMREQLWTLQGENLALQGGKLSIGELVYPFLARKYGHPEGLHTKKLLKVPWLE